MLTPKFTTSFQLFSALASWGRRRSPAPLVSGLALMAFAQFCFAAMVAALKYANVFPGTNGVPPGVWEAVGLRSAVMAAFCLLLISFGPRKPSNGLVYPPGQWRWLAIRGGLGALSMGAVFYSGLHLPLAVGSLFLNSNVFFVSIFAYVFLGETLSATSLVCLLGGFLGVGIVLGEDLGTSASPAAGFWSTLFHYGVAASSGLLSAIAMFSLRKMRHIRPAHFVLSLSFGGLILSALAAANGSLQWAAIGHNWVPLGLSALAGVVGQFSLTYAYRLAPAGPVSFGVFTGPLFSALIDFSVFSALPGPRTFLGLALVLLCGVGMAWSNLKSKKVEVS